MKLSEFYAWLDTYLNFEKTQTKNIFWLDSMRFLCEHLGNPQNDIPCIHVAGSKGKGSVSTMIASCIEKEGLSCGLYTSPHITDFRERIGSAHGFFTDDVYEKAADTLVQTVQAIPKEDFPAGRALTWFELVTAFSFLCFKEAKCDFAVYETGLGGRLDSTNIIFPKVSVITPIEFEHTEFLGDTIEKIAAEKAGIIKPHVPVVISSQNHKKANKVFKQKAKEVNSKCIFVDKITKNLTFEYTQNGKMKVLFHQKTPGSNFFAKNAKTEKFFTELKLLGKVQAQNAVTATAALKTALPNINKTSIEEGLSNAFLPGRFEIYNNFVLDGAHTIQSIKNTVNTLKEVFPKKNYHLLFACAGDKDMEDIIPLFRENFNSVVFTKPATVRNSKPELCKKIADTHKIPSIIKENLFEALSFIKTQLKNDDIILVTGSFYLVSEVKEILKKNG